MEYFQALIPFWIPLFYSLTTLLLTCIYAFLYFNDRRKYLKLYTFSWLVFAAAYFILYISLTEEYLLLMLPFSLFLMAGGFFFHRATFVYLGRSGSVYANYATFLGFLLLIAITLFEASLIYGQVIVFSFTAFYFLHAGYLLIRSLKRPYSYVGALAVVVGLNNAIYPFAFYTDWYYPWGYGLTGVIALAVALGIVDLHLYDLNKAMRESEERYRLISQNISDIIWTTDMNLNYTYISPSIKKVLGYPPEELINLNIAETLESSSLEKAMQVFQNEVIDAPFIKEKTDKTVTLELEHIRKDGSHIWTEVIVSYLRDETGAPVALLGINRDITTRKQAEDALSAQLSFEKLVAEISSFFAALPVEQLYAGIDHALKMAGEYFRIDRSYVFQFSEENKTRSLTHEWCAKGIEPLKEKLWNQSLGKLSWWKDKLESSYCIRIPDVDNLPPEAEGEKRDFKAQQLKSLIAVPLTREGKVFGALGFDSIKQHMHWTREHEHLLTVLAELVSFAIAKQEARKKLRESEEKTRAILKALPDLMFVYNREGVYLNYHVANESMLAVEPEYFLNKPVHEVLPGEIADKFMDCFAKASETGNTQTIEYFLKALGGYKHFEARITPLSSQQFVAVVRDITDRKMAEEALKGSEQKYREILSTMEESYYEVDLAGNFVFFNESLCRLLDYRSDELMDESYKRIYKNPEEVFNTYNRVYKTGKPVVAEDWPMITSNGREIYVEISLALRHDESGEPIGFRGVGRDITQRKLADERIRYLSFHDQLTGLYNRHFMEEEMKRIDTARQLPLSIIMADLNGLKLINDTYGHLTGDEFLKNCAAILQKVCREEDIIARWGGDEFVILLPQTTEEVAWSLCQRINRICNNAYVEEIPLSMALGVGSKPEMGIDLKMTLKEAEDNMYKQKLADIRSNKSNILKTLLKTLEEKSYETETHTQGMRKVAQEIGEKMNLTDTELNRLDLLITLHDIGKINIPEEILTKKGTLTEKEWTIIKEHPEIGFRITRATEEFAHVAEDILAHHEHWDGSGYPRGLKGKEIPFLARITAIADAFEVMSRGRPYKAVLQFDEIVDEFKKCAGSQFDPQLVDILLPIIESDRYLFN